jgi:type II secretion system protein N
MTIKPKVLDTLKGEPRFDMSGKAYGGEINGSFNVTDKEKGDFTSLISMRSIAFAELGLLAGKYGHKLLGSLSGEMDYGRDSSGAAGGSGKADLHLADGQLQFEKPMLNIDAVNINSLRVEAELARRTITVLKADLAGPELNGKMTGTIQLHKDMGSSQLNLKGSIEPLAEFYQKYPEIPELLKAMNKRIKRGQIPFAVTGTLDKPRFQLQ